jgi:hypothetical protein
MPYSAQDQLQIALWNAGCAAGNLDDCAHEGVTATPPPAPQPTPQPPARVVVIPKTSFNTGFSWSNAQAGAAGSAYANTAIANGGASLTPAQLTKLVNAHATGSKPVPLVSVSRGASAISNRAAPPSTGTQNGILLAALAGGGALLFAL